MKLSDFLAGINEIVESRPECLDFEVLIVGCYASIGEVERFSVNEPSENDNSTFFIETDLCSG
jgi:hypothetical protein